MNRPPHQQLGDEAEGAGSPRQTLSSEHAAMLASSLRILANATRLRLLSIILAQPDERATVSLLTEAVGLRQPSVSYQLGLMHEAGILEREPAGRQVWYSVHPQMRETIGDLVH